MKSLILTAVAALGLAACTPAEKAASTVGLTLAGVPAPLADTITTAAGATGQLLCDDAGQWKAVAGANVLNASAQAVAKVCATVAVGAIPGMPSTPTTAAIVTVGQQVLDMLNASKQVASSS